MYLLSRNKIMDYQVWRDYFNVNTISYEEAGLMIKSLWHEASSTQSEFNVFCMFKVCDPKKAKSFLNAPELIQQQTKAGVIEKEHHFLDELPHFIRH
ncbi:hypothetical protein [Vibrio algivorus]|uniref:hypothetical protein n=1 Tax=Vibrio algivorus TaxID=1667024 RepID=UPI000B5C536A|nr:hypothetical protein [Vibrio algivorus]